MNNTKHTAGPWSYAHGSKDLITGPDGQDVAYVDTSIPERTRAERTANLELIRRAPELLRAAAAYRNHLRTAAHTEEQVRTYEHLCELLDNL